MHSVLDRIRRAPSILHAIRLADDLVRAASELPAHGKATDAGQRALFDALDDSFDAPTAIAAAHALGTLRGPIDEARLAERLAPGGWLAPHVAWSLAGRAPSRALVGPLVDLVAGGRLAGMLAQGTLVGWSADPGAGVAESLAGRLSRTADPLVRARLVETLGRGGPGTTVLARIASDRDEATEARIAAVAALGDRPGGHSTLLVTLAAGDDAVAGAARLALLDRRSPGVGGETRAPRGSLRLMQVHLGARLDRELAHAGEGDTGGIATLLVQLGNALADDPRVHSITTVGRGSEADALSARSADVAGHSVLAAPLGRHEDASFAGAWPAAIAAGRGLRRILRQRPASVIHLRMADVGTLAASRIARRQGIPTVFSLAPDPHAVLVEMERSGEIDRATFGAADARGGLWFRIRLVHRLAEAAGQVALFPRPELARRLEELVGLDIAADPRRYHVVPEGIDPGPVDVARLALGRSSHDVDPVIADLRAALDALPAGRRGLPLVVSVGRLAEVKGMSRLAAAFSTDADLRRRANLLIVGGDLRSPTPDEEAEIERLREVVAATPEVADALVVFGHRPHDEVLRLLAVAEAGDGPWVAAGGAYACGSRKEEFGLAIVEAMAIGLPIVAPGVGGPATYVEEGITGRLVDTADAEALVAGIHGALDLATVPGRADRARTLVRSRFTIGAMASALVPIYVSAADRSESVAA